MELTDNKKQEVELEYEKLIAIINHVQTIARVPKECDSDVKDFIVDAGIAIYNKI